MPIVVDPSYTPPPPPTVVTSPDGILTATVDTTHAGVLLTANYSTDPTVAKVRFLRGDGTAVRSGDTAWAPGGWANAYDHEAPLGVGVSWYAVPIGFDGTEGTPSALVAVEIPAPEWGLWIKPVLDPGASMLIEVLAGTRPHARRARNAFSDVPGASLGVASWDRRGPIEMQAQLRTATPAESVALSELLDSGPLLIQPAPRYALPGIYALAGDEAWDYENDAQGTGRRVWSLPFTEIARPATLDAPLLIPGRSWDQVAAGYASYDDLAAQVESYNALLGAPSGA